MVFDPTKAGKTFCACGNPAETFGGQCDRCASLQMLGLGTYASQEEIESTYHTLVKVWHPDRFPTDPTLRLAAEEKLKEINAAHDFLVSDQSQSASAQAQATPQRPQPSRPFQADPEIAESDEVEKILRSQKKSVLPAILLRAGFAIGGLALIALVLLTADSFISSNPKAERSWEELKTEVSHDLRASGVRLTPDSAKPQDSTTAAPPATSAPEAPVTPAPPQPEPREAVKSAKVPVKTLDHVKTLQPYITSGLTPMEVLSVLGKPSSSAGERMFYQGSEIDFRNGQVAGWKIDPKSPIRAKLWPDSPPVPGLTTFSIGSSKSDVITLQGTPTLFSENEFGYGNSLVFFQNNRVVSWKEDPASVRLRVPH